MFNRVSKTAFICLRCQSRLLSQRSSSSQLNGLGQSKTATRWQSTALAVAEEDYDHDEDLSRGDFPTQTRERKPRRREVQRWRHEEVAELGVSALGKPAEVLVLHPRDRRILKVPDEDDREHEVGLNEALEAEVAPLNAEQVRENIEHFRRPFGNDGQILESERWRELKHNLIQGFTHLQLLEYVRQKEANTSTTTEQTKASAATLHLSKIKTTLNKKTISDTRAPGRVKLKKLMVTYIMKHIWGFSQTAEEEGLEDKTTTALLMRPYHIGTLAIHQTFEKLAEAHNVKITISGETRNKIVFDGNKDAVAKARSEVMALKTQIKVMTIELGPAKSLLSKLQDARYERVLYHEVAQNRSVYIDPKGDKSLHINYLPDQLAEAEAARRDILLAGFPQPQNSRFSICPPLTQRQTWLVPYHVWESLPPWESHKRWGRLGILARASEQKPNASSRTDAPNPGQAKEVYKHLQTSNLTSEAGSRFELRREEYTVLLGQSLFRPDITQSIQGILGDRDSSKQSDVDTKWSLDVPLLAQFLSSCRQWSVDTKRPVAKKHIVTSNRSFMHRLQLVPSQIQSPAPDIEIFLTGEKAELGLRQPLRILSISAILEEQSQVLLQPELPVDLNFLRQTKYDFYIAGLKRDPKNSQFNDQFLRFLNTAQGQDVPAFAPFVKLSMPTALLHRFETADTAIASDPEVMKQPVGELSAVSVVPPVKPTYDLPRASPTEYMLAASETIEARSFSNPAWQDLCLDHVHFQDLDGAEDRQQLRLAATPLLAPQGSGPNNFTKLFRGACNLASKLGDTQLNKERV